MKRLAALAVLVLLPLSLYARSLNIDPAQSGSILIGTSTASPTQIFNNDKDATKTCVVNSSTNTVYFVGYSTSSNLSINTNATISTNTTTGSFYLQGILVNGTTVQAQTFCFDGNNDNFTGPMWAVAGGNGAVVQRIRCH